MTYRLSLFSKPADDELEVALLGRGFGESIVIHCGDGSYAVIDSLIDDEGDSAPLSYLRSCGADLGKVARIVATHWHDDHVDGISELYAACPNAGLVLPLVLNEAEFQGFVRKKGRTGTSRVSSGVQQLVSLLEIKRLENRPPANFAHAATTIYRRADGRFPVVFTALSPCAEDVDRFLGNIGRQMANDPGDIRADPINPNDVSVAILAEVGSHSILLGADLINLADSTRGWKAVVSSSDRPQVRSQIFKIPHHGAENAHNADVWTKMLIEKPISILAPFNHGVGVPKASDVTRIMSLSANSYSTTVTPFRKPKGDARVSSKSLEEDGYKIASTSDEVGVVRIRAPLDGSSPAHVELFSGACHLRNFVAKAA